MAEECWNKCVSRKSHSLWIKNHSTDKLSLVIKIWASRFKENCTVAVFGSKLTWEGLPRDPGGPISCSGTQLSGVATGLDALPVFNLCCHDIYPEKCYLVGEGSSLFQLPIPGHHSKEIKEEIWLGILHLPTRAERNELIHAQLLACLC